MALMKPEIAAKRKDGGVLCTRRILIDTCAFAGIIDQAGPCWGLRAAM